MMLSSEDDFVPRGEADDDVDTDGAVLLIGSSFAIASHPSTPTFSI